MRRDHSRRITRVCWGLTSVLLLGCTGDLLGGDAHGSAARGGSAVGDGDGDAHSDSPIDPADPTYATASLRRLTLEEYTNTVQDLLGEGVVILGDLEPDETADEGFEFRSVGAGHVTTSIRGVEQYDVVARDLAAQVFANETLRDLWVGCTPQGTDETCEISFLRDAGRRAWRRPLTDTEIERYLTLVSDVGELYGDTTKGMEAATAALLSSPFFLYRAELGAPRDGVRALDDYELAARLSYLIWQTTPDQELLDAAEAGELSEAVSRRAQAERLLADERAKETLIGFFAEWLGFRDLAGVPKDPVEFPEFSPELAAAMQSELEQLVGRYVTDESLAWMDIYTTRESFLNTELAGWYGVTGPTGETLEAFTFAETSPRAGLLTTAGFLTANSRATMTSPTLRGAFINERLLCVHIPPPPPQVDPTLPPPPADGQLETMRDRLARHTEEPSCAGCHVPMDTPGLALEQFDATGRYRTTEFGLTVDPSGEMMDETFSDAKEFGAILGASDQVSECAVRHLYRHALATHEEEGEAHVIEGMHEAALSDGGSVRAMLLELISHEGFILVGGLY